MGKLIVAALAGAWLVTACGQPAGPVSPPSRTAFETQNYVIPNYLPTFGYGGYGGWGTLDAWGAPGFPYAFGFPNYVQPIYTPNIGNPFAAPPLAAGPWINPIYRTVNYSVGFPWSTGWNGIPAL